MLCQYPVQLLQFDACVCPKGPRNTTVAVELTAPCVALHVLSNALTPLLWLQNIPLYQKAGAGLAAGGLGALVGSPADLSLIRMQADSTLPEAQKRHYKGVGDALTRIVKDEGAIGLFRGAGPTVTRAMALNMGMLASNDQVRMCLILQHVHAAAACKG